MSGPAASLSDRVGAQWERIQRFDRRYRSVVSTVPDAIDRAGEAESRRGGLSLTIGVKDVIDTAGHATSMGSPSFSDNIPDEDATVVERLRTAGAVVTVKTHLSEFAMGATSQNQHFGAVGNAWGPERVAGGSSGGSAVAVAAGFVDAALGTDTGGSILVPSALNGVVGLRPSTGAVPNRGVFPVSVHYDTVGPIARDVATARRLFDAIAGADAADPYQRSPRSASEARPVGDLRIGVAGGHFEAGETITEGLATAVEVIGRMAKSVAGLELSGAEHAQDHMANMMFADFLLAHEHRFAQDPEQFGEDLRFRLRLGESTTGLDYARGRRDALAWRVELDAAFRALDVIVTPTVIRTAPLLSESSTVATSPVLTRFTHPWCLWDGPTLTVPIGCDSEGLPYGMSLTARPGEEHVLFLLGEAYQDASDWHLRVPQLEEPVERSAP